MKDRRAKHTGDGEPRETVGAAQHAPSLLVKKEGLREIAGQRSQRKDSG